MPVAEAVSFKICFIKELNNNSDNKELARKLLCGTTATENPIKNNIICYTLHSQNVTT